MPEFEDGAIYILYEYYGGYIIPPAQLCENICGWYMAGYTLECILSPECCTIRDLMLAGF